jgi:NAD(P)-dependent dehydrogenase (short-subunit alcohol dehydrogenase family)
MYFNMSFDLTSAPSQKGRIAVVTGANIGLGYEITIGLAKKGAKIIMACRNLQKAEIAKQNIEKKVPDADLEIMELDLSSLQSVHDFAKSYSEKYKHLDLLIENA